MADDAELPGVSGKQTRRGKRANKKPNSVSIEHLNAAIQKLELQPKKRPPRRPKNPEQRSAEKSKPTTSSPIQQNAGFQMGVQNIDHVQDQNLIQINQKVGGYVIEETKKMRRKPKRERYVQGVDENDSRGKIENLNINGSKNVSTNDNRNKMPKSQSNNSTKIDKNKFPDYIPEGLMLKLLTDQKTDNIEYVKGYIRINAKAFKEAYVAMPDNELDVLIDGIQDRNRALDGDLVAIKINPIEKWRGMNGSRPQKTGKVVCILKKIHHRKIVGFLKPLPDNNPRVALFSPRDHKVPRLNIDSCYWPPNYNNDPEYFADTMFLAEITRWNDVRFAHGKILEMIGESGDLKTESAAILLENDLDVKPYPDELTQDLPPSDYKPSTADIEGREDWRKQCIFTIDPPTAADLDDALSCKPLDNGNFEVGVHIADVTHFLEQSSPLDKAASLRATTVYLSDAVYHMLPKQLCNVCSLLPGSDKLAFSIIFEITPEGEVLKHRFVKTVINSCCQFSYDHAQTMIMNPDKQWSDDELPVIKGPYKISDLSTVVNNLNNLALKMRKRRVDRGTLRIDQPKLHVFVDRTSGLPVSFTLEEQKDSNRLIEEFMLLSNITVATHLYKNLPDISMLRCHDPPIMHMLSKTKAMLEKLGVHIDIESAGALHASLTRNQPDPYTSSEKEIYLANCRSMVMNALCAKPMMRARYFCTSAETDLEFFKHYALNVPLYTHFTSPIRRYPDCVVHRLLYASIQNALPVPNWTPELCAEIAENCNRQKMRAQRAQEMSSELYLSYLVGLEGPVDTTAIAMDVKDRSIDVIVCSMGIDLRIYVNEEKNKLSLHHTKDDDIQTLTILWEESHTIQVINVFSIINIRVSKHQTTNRLQGELLPPK